MKEAVAPATASFSYVYIHLIRLCHFIILRCQIPK